MFDAPSAQAKTILDRNASVWVDLARRAHRCSWSRSASVSASPAFGRPGRGRSASPASRDSANRRRTLWTVITLTPSSSASRAYTTPGSEQASTILARTAAAPLCRPTSPATEPAPHWSSRTRSSVTAATIRDTINTYGADLRRDTLVHFELPAPTEVPR